MRHHSLKRSLTTNGFSLLRDLDMMPCAHFKYVLGGALGKQVHYEIRSSPQLFQCVNGKGFKHGCSRLANRVTRLTEKPTLPIPGIFLHGSAFSCDSASQGGMIYCPSGSG
eukprot:Blabericola_migrator_1__4950@NODE_257_length_10777_cov_171_650047_g215_i0_p11_GENE_NODE_257_length_10777_cov_171_650047_g215_i0NODE_257_length_10777_cov_171_650047_g215_i0_p11_ORF_typecomplete_len111_score1_97_NODE_257_length_10777_cov_171_650047_g215_i09911323